MDNVDTECESKSESLAKPNEIHKLMVDDAMRSFFQLENLTSSLDAKAFGIVTIGSLIFSFFTYGLTLFDFNYLYVPVYF